VNPLQGEESCQSEKIVVWETRRSKLRFLRCLRRRSNLLHEKLYKKDIRENQKTENARVGLPSSLHYPMRFEMHRKHR
jgi:hypothetical protein